MKEALLHYIWQYRQYAALKLKTKCGQSIQVLKTGIHNTHAGPDFEYAHICIGNTKWAGSVEVHLKSSDWNKHKHQNDAAYNNVILHVVWEDDTSIQNQLGEQIPTLELKNLVSEKLLSKYELLMQHKAWIPCENFIGDTEQTHLHCFLDRLLIERLQEKSLDIKKVLEDNKNDWEETFYQFFCRSLGLQVNAEPMFQLAQLLPQKILAKHSPNLFQLEALLFGVGGFLQESKEEYSRQLLKEFEFLKHKYKLQEINLSQWKFLRLRPASFPTIRLSQLANLIHQHSRMFSKVLEATSIKELEQLFETQTSDYWQKHYRFGVESEKRRKSIGKQLVHNIVINTVSPFYILYSKAKNKNVYQQKALSFLSVMKPEKNTIIRQFESLDVSASSAAQSQALLQLKKHYCGAKKCLQCVVGVQMLN